ncbi:hypothetical protein ABLN87_05935 [Ruegeria sp. SCPT10]|uniref:hypothetical protein n=1 Tax=Ruegeria sp. SCP10 TaxID=3141377 RepID=UPI003337EC9A
MRIRRRRRLFLLICHVANADDVKRPAVRDVTDRPGLSERRACELAELHRSVIQYQKQDRGGDALPKRLRELANERRRFGHQKRGVLQ